jgi:hypothetical protein
MMIWRASEIALASPQSIIEVEKSEALPGVAGAVFSVFCQFAGEGVDSACKHERA